MPGDVRTLPSPQECLPDLRRAVPVLEAGTDRFAEGSYGAAQSNLRKGRWVEGHRRTIQVREDTRLPPASDGLRQQQPQTRAHQSKPALAPRVQSPRREDGGKLAPHAVEGRAEGCAGRSAMPGEGYWR